MPSGVGQIERSRDHRGRAVASHSEPPSSPGEERALWDRLFSGDATATADFVLAYLDPLTEWLIRKFHNVDEHLCSQAAEDTLLALVKNPAGYDPNQASLRSFL